MGGSFYSPFTAVAVQISAEMLYDEDMILIIF